MYREFLFRWLSSVIYSTGINLFLTCVLDTGHTLIRRGNICLHRERYNWVSIIYAIIWGFSSGSVGKESACNAGDIGDAGSILGQEDPLEKGNGKPLQYSCLKNPMDRGAWWAIVQSVAKSRTWLSD